EVEALLADEGRLASWLDILAALARAQGELGLIPAAAADEIVRQADLENLDLAYVIEQTRATEHSTLGLIRGVQQVLSPEAGEWFCYGATVQDVAGWWCATWPPWRRRCAGWPGGTRRPRSPPGPTASPACR